MFRHGSELRRRPASGSRREVSVIVVTAVTAIGLLAVGTLSQLYGFRLGGTIAVPVLAVYTLKNVLMLPIFLLSTVLAYVGLRVVKDQTLAYGRDELLVAMTVGSLIPIGLLLLLTELLPSSLRSVVFIGSILPGLAAYNYHQLKPGSRLRDAGVASALLFGLLALGWLLVSPGLRPVIGTLTPAALYAVTADVAAFKGAAVSATPEPTIFERPIAVGLFVVGVVLSERVRARYGLRIGLMAMALLAVYALANVWLLFLYAVTLAVAYAFLQTLHRETMLYGRVTISVTTAVAVVLVVPLVLVTPVTRGLSAYFVGVLAGINAYNWHTAHPARRLDVPLLKLGTFAVLLIVARGAVALIPDAGRVLQTGVPSNFGPLTVVAGLFVAAVAYGLVERRIVEKPSTDDVFDSSILSGGER